MSGTVLPGMSGPVNDPDYARSLGMPSALRMIGEFEGMVSADYHLVEMVERGYASFDMKPMLLGGRRARITKDGRRYNIIPFRFGTPQAGGGSRAHFPGEMTMPRSVYNIVRLGAEYPQEDTEGMRTKIADFVNQQAAIRSMNLPMDGSYTWKAGLYAGMRGYGSGRQRQYFTFRTVSTPVVSYRRTQLANGKIVSTKRSVRGSDPNSWIHPGRAENPVMQAVVDDTRPRVDAFLTNTVRAFALPFLRP